MSGCSIQLLARETSLSAGVFVEEANDLGLERALLPGILCEHKGPFLLDVVADEDDSEESGWHAV